MKLALDAKLKHQAWTGLEWIWTPEDLAHWPPTGKDSRYFRQTIALPGKPLRAWIQVWSDMGYEVWVNGSSAYQAPCGLAWSHRDEIEHFLHEGENIIAIEFYPGPWRFGGLLVAGEVELADGQIMPLRSDTTWLCREDLAADWHLLDASLTGWHKAQRTVDGWKTSAAAIEGHAARGVDTASFDPGVFQQQVASFYGVNDAEQLHIPSERCVAFQAGGYWAPLANLPDGSIGAIVRAGGCHSGRDGRLLFIRSRDGGKTWSAPIVVADSPWCDYGCAFGALQNGTLIVGYRKIRNYDGRGNFMDPGDSRYPQHCETLVIRSEDGGETWESPRIIAEASLPYGNIIGRPDGSVWMHEYPHGTGSGYRISRDKGKSWGPPRTITDEPCSETALCDLRDGRIVAAMRGSVEGGEATFVSVTDDEGATWSTPIQVTGLAEMPPDLIQLQGGRLLLVFGRRTFPNGVQVMFSDDRGDTWYRPERFILTSDALHDHGYPATVQLDDGTIVTIYYATGNRLHPEIDVHTGVVRWREEDSRINSSRKGGVVGFRGDRVG